MTPVHDIINQNSSIIKETNESLKFISGWKYAAFVGSIVGFIGLACYPIIVEPMLNPDKYKKIQKINREGEI